MVGGTKTPGWSVSFIVSLNFPYAPQVYALPTMGSIDNFRELLTEGKTLARLNCPPFVRELRPK